MMKPTKAQAKDRIQRALDAIPELMSMPRSSQEFTKWHRNTRISIEYTFGEDSQYSRTFNSIEYSPGIVINGIPNQPFQEAYLGGLKYAESILESMLEEIEEYWDDDVQARAANGQPSTSEPITTNRVFVVHGRDEAAKHTLARYLGDLGLEPVILQEQPSQGRTIIEKFEEESQTVGFAVVLGTPDDIGALAIDKDNLRPRMRQNVVLELGYFAGKLGRKRVCVLLKPDVERPSDYDGVIYIPLDDFGGWRTELDSELKAAGLQIGAST